MHSQSFQTETLKNDFDFTDRNGKDFESLDLPCIIPDLSSDYYHTACGISRSGLMHFRRSPFHYFNHCRNPLKPEKEDSRALVFGSALHTFILENNQFFERYFVLPKIDRRTKEGKLTYELYQTQNSNKIMLTQEEMEKISQLTHAVFNSYISDQLIKGAKYEHSIFWVDDDEKVICKARPDAWHDNMVVDIKTTMDASADAFNRDMFTYGYHMQAAMMQDGIYQATGDNIEDFFFLCIEKDWPHATAIHQISKEDIQCGRAEYKRHLSTYARCKANNEWPGYPIAESCLSNYAKQRSQ